MADAKFPNNYRTSKISRAANKNWESGKQTWNNLLFILPCSEEYPKKLQKIEVYIKIWNPVNHVNLINFNIRFLYGN